MTLCLAVTTIYGGIACLVTMLFTKHRPPTDWYDGWVIWCIGMFWPITAIMAVSLAVEWLVQTRRRNARLK